MTRRTPAARASVLAVALVLPCAAVVASATCPPAGETRASLLALKARQWQLPQAAPDAAAARRTLALALVHCLAEPDPVLRDDVAFDALQTWMRAGLLDRPTLHTLRSGLMAMLAAPADAAGFRQPFAALVLAEVARVDRLQPWLSADERDGLVAQAARYLAGVQDLRGFDPVEGWRHGVAHGADLMLQLALNPALQRDQALVMLQAIASQVRPAGEHAWRYGEPARLAAPVFHLARREWLQADDWQRWFDGLTRRPPGETGVTPASLARRHNLQAFLAVLYTTVQESAAPEPRERLLPALRQALRAPD
jgi:Protein of unknown function (DUF2785)